MSGSSFSYLKSLGKAAIEYPTKAGIAGLKALKSSLGAIGSISILKRASIFIKSFIDRILKIRKSKEKVTKRTESEIQKETQAAVGSIKESLGLSKEKGKDGEKIEEAVAHAVRAFHEADAKTMDNAKLNAEQASKLGLVGVITISQLRKKYPTQSAFKKVLKKLVNTESKVKLPAKHLIRTSLVGIFKLKDEKAALNFLKRLNIQPTDKVTAEAFYKLSHGPSDTDVERVSKALHKNFLAYTSLANIKKAVKLVKNMCKSSKGVFNVDDFTKFAFYIDPKDFPNMIKALSGKQSSKAVTAEKSRLAA